MIVAYAYSNRSRSSCGLIRVPRRIPLAPVILTDPITLSNEIKLVRGKQSEY